MDDKIKAYASLKFHMDHPEISFDNGDLSGEIPEGQTFSGSFSITSSNDVPITGNVEVFDHRIELLNGEFKTTSFTVSFMVHAEDMKADSVISGAFHVLTNGGEYDVPYSYNVVNRSFFTAGGVIHNLKEFADCAQINFDEAVKELYNPDFLEILLNGDEHIEDRRIYLSLLSSPIREQALEEFLITTGVKDKIELKTSRSDAVIRYDKEDCSKDITITKNNWGYIDAEISCEDKAVYLAKTHLTRDDFIGKEAKIPVVVSIDQLSEDEYDIPLKISSVYQELEFKLQIRKKSRSKKKQHGEATFMFSNLSLKKTYQSQLIGDYIDYRAGRLPLQQYTNRSIECADELMKLEESHHWYRLVRLHMYIMKKDKVRVAQEIENIENYEEMMLDDDLSIAYFAYLKALNSSSDDDIEYAIDINSECMSRHPDEFAYFFMLSYLDPDLIEDRSAVYDGLLALYERGCNSPFLYFEACDLINEYPHIMRDFNDFLLQTINWAYKRGDLTRDVIARVLELAKEHKSYNRKLLKFLMRVYKDTPDDDVLYIICTMLIKGNITDSMSHYYYSLGIDKSFKLIGLMECYLKSIDDSDYPVLPKSVVLYFSYSSERLDEDMLAYLYSNVVVNRMAYGATFNEYESQIKDFVISEVMKGRIGEHLLVLYKEYLSDSHIIANVAPKLPDILFMNRFTCDNPDIVEVILEYDECDKVERARVQDGLAYLDCVTKNVGITLIDRRGNRYIGSIDYKLEPLFDDEEYLPYCYQADQNSFKLLLRLADFGWSSEEIDYEIIKVFKALLLFDGLKSGYRKRLNAAILEYFYHQYEGDIFEGYLRELSLSNLDSDNQALAMGYMIERELYDQAYEAVKELGYYRLSDDNMKDLLTYEVELDDVEVDDVLIGMSYELFHREMYTESILKYMIRYAKGGNNELMAIYKVAKNNHLECTDLIERIIIQAIMVDCYDDDMIGVFLDYLKCDYDRYVYQAFVNALSYRIFIKSAPITEDIGAILRDGFLKGHVTHELNQAALLYIYSKNLDQAKEDVNIVTDIIDFFVKKDMLMPFMAAFSDIIEIPEECYVKSFLTYIDSPMKNIDVHIKKRDLRRSESRTERMREYFMGYYVKDFVLFDNEEIDYYLTVNDDDKVVRVEQADLPLYRPASGDETSAFSMINRMVKGLKDEEDIFDKMELYIKNKHILEENMIIL